MKLKDLELIKLSEESKKGLLALAKHYGTTFPRTAFIRKLEQIDKAHHSETQVNKIVLSEDETSERVYPAEIPIVRPKVSAEVSFYSGMFLNDTQIFSAVVSPEAKSNSSPEELQQHEAAVKMFNSKLSEDELRTGWVTQFRKFFTNIAKHDIAAIGIEWEEQPYPSLGFSTGSFSSAITKQNNVWEGNKISNINMYNIIFDTRVDPKDVSLEGEFIGSITAISQNTLYNLLTKWKTAKNVAYLLEEEDEKAIWGNETVLGDTSSDNLGYYVPSIGKTGDPKKSGKIGWDLLFNGIETGVSGKEAKLGITTVGRTYTRVTLYTRIIPDLFDITCPESDKVQIWKLELINGKLVAASPEDNGHGYFPILLASTDTDDCGLQGRGDTAAIVQLQEIAMHLQTKRFGTLDRSIGDRAILDTRYIDKSQMTSAAPDAKIAVELPKASQKSLADVYMPIPYQDAQSGAILSEIQYIISYAQSLGPNKAQQGQFVKGNKTLEEFNRIMQNADGRLISKAQELESSCMLILKQILKINMLLRADTKPIGTDQSNKFSSASIVAAAMEYKLASGLTPKSKLLNSPGLRLAVEYARNDPNMSQRYDVFKLLVDMLQAEGDINLKDYEVQQPMQGGQPPQTNGGTPPQQ